MKNNVRIPCPICTKTMKCGTNTRVLQDNRDGIALCMACGFRASVVLTYDVASRGSDLRIPPSVPPGQTIKAPQVFCLVCRGAAWVRTSQRLSHSLKILRIYCLSKECGHRANAYLELVEQLTIQPGAAHTGIPYRAGLIEALKRELSHTNTLPRLIHER